ncbi:MAG: hypothetical protein ACK4PR_09400, partial [Gammaproteobacteria bacterium]
TSSIYQGMAYIYMYDIRELATESGITLPQWQWDQSQMSTLMTLTALQDLKQDVLHHADDNSAFFAHILLPHSPYIYNQDCQIQTSPMSWLINYDFGPQGNDAVRRKLRYQLYNTQLFCLYKQLNDVFNTWQQAGIMKKAIIIVNGDHSARLPIIAPTIENNGKSTRQDFDDAFPALFAIKAPGYPAGIDDSQASITYLFDRALQQIVGASLETDNNQPYVFLTNNVPDLRGQQQVEPISAFKLIGSH